MIYTTGWQAGFIPTWSTLRKAFIGIFWETLAEKKSDQISVSFDIQIADWYDVNITTTGDGSVNHVWSVAQLTATTWTAKIVSRDAVRYRPWHTVGALFTMSWTGAMVQQWLYDTESWVFVKIENWIPSVGYRNNSVDTIVTELNWDITGIDFSKINVYLITLGYLGVANIDIYILNNDWNFQKLHEFKTAWALTNTHISSPKLPITSEVSGNSTLSTASWNGFILGGSGDIWTRVFSFPNIALQSWATDLLGSVALTGTTVQTLALFRNSTTFNWRTNKVKALLVRYKLYVDVPPWAVLWSVVFQFIANPVLTGTPTYIPIESTLSVMSYDSVVSTGAVAKYSSGGKIAITEILEYSWANKWWSAGNEQFDSRALGTVAYPGDVFALIAKDTWGNNVNVRFTLNWGEEF